MKAFTSLLVFIGLLWDLDNRQVSLPENKRLKFLSQVNSFIAQFTRGACTLRDIEKLHGSLCYLSFVYPEGRSRLSSLSNFSTKFKDNGYIRSDWRGYTKPAGFPGKGRPGTGRGSHLATPLKPLPRSRVWPGIALRFADALPCQLEINYHQRPCNIACGHLRYAQIISDLFLL